MYCIGYTGLGTEEYFDDTTGIPISDGDTFGLVEAVEAVVSEYDEDPRRLDAMRRRASERVNARYSTELFERTLLTQWAEIDSALANASV